MMQVAAFAIALSAAALMGFASPRGGTCMVAALTDIVTRRRYGRMIALLEGTLWVACGFILLNAFHLLDAVPPDYPAGLATIAGGVVFALGAFVNQACLLGTVARLGSGDWAYAATPIGMFLGYLAVARLSFAVETQRDALVFAAPPLAAAAALLVAAARFSARRATIQRRQKPTLGRLWSPHVATILTALAFMVAFATAGNWDYGHLVRDLAWQPAAVDLSRTLLALTLVAGALLGGWTAGLLKPIVPDGLSVARCVAGGALMGFGATLVPGGNTVLIFLAMPMPRPYAWLGFVAMCVTLYVALRLRRSAAAL